MGWDMESLCARYFARDQVRLSREFLRWLEAGLEGGAVWSFEPLDEWLVFCCIGVADWFVIGQMFSRSESCDLDSVRIGLLIDDLLAWWMCLVRGDSGLRFIRFLTDSTIAAERLRLWPFWKSVSKTFSPSSALLRESLSCLMNFDVSSSGYTTTC